MTDLEILKKAIPIMFKETPILEKTDYDTTILRGGSFYFDFDSDGDLLYWRFQPTIAYV